MERRNFSPGSARPEVAAQDGGHGTGAPMTDSLHPAGFPAGHSSGRGTRRLVASLLIAAVIPVLLLSGSLAYMGAQQNRTLARHMAFDAVARVVALVGSEISKEIEVETALASSAALDRGDLQTLYDEAQRVTDARQLWGSVQLADPSGKQVLNLLRPYGEPLGPTVERDSFDAVVRTRRPSVGGIGPPDSISGKRSIALRVPVIRQDRLAYVLTVALAPNGLDQILAEARIPKTWFAAIVDGSGNVIAHNPDSMAVGRDAGSAAVQAIARGSRGFYHGPNLEGINAETVFQKIPNTSGWSVHLGIPEDELNAPVSQSFGILIGGAAISIVLACGLALLIGRDITQRRRDAEDQAALALRLSEERGNVAIEAAELGTWRWDLDYDEITGSERFRMLLDLPRAAPNGVESAWSSDIFLRAIADDDSESVRAAVDEAVATEGPLDVQFRALHPGGLARWRRMIGRCTRLDRHACRVLHGVIADVEQQRRREAERTDLLRRLDQAQEQERRRIARDLHDQVGQSVTGLSLSLKGLEDKLCSITHDTSALAAIRTVRIQTTEIGREIHRAASDLRPTALDDFGLYKAVSTYAFEWGGRFGVEADIQTLGPDERLPTDVETAVYRAIQEALTNVAKHAQARSVSILLERRADRLTAIVEDDGRGFDPERPGRDNGGIAQPHLGLSGIRERMAMIGGTMRLETSPGAGTTVFLEVRLS